MDRRRASGQELALPKKCLAVHSETARARDPVQVMVSDQLVLAVALALVPVLEEQEDQEQEGTLGSEGQPGSWVQNLPG